MLSTQQQQTKTNKQEDTREMRVVAIQDLITVVDRALGQSLNDEEA